MNSKALYSERTYLTNILGVDLTYLFACPLSEAHMGSRHCTAAAVLMT